MGEDIVGRPVNAVLAPPQAERFAAVAGVDLNRLVLHVTGWNKLVLLDCDRVFLFRRSAIGMEWFERELAAYRALAKTQLGIVPHLPFTPTGEPRRRCCSDCIYRRRPDRRLRRPGLANGRGTKSSG